MSETQPTATETKIYFGVALELAGKVISLEPKNAITELKEKGIEVELPPGERVYLGTVGKSLSDILGALGIEDLSFLDSETGELNPASLPDISALQNAASLVVDAGLYVDAFHVRIPGSAATSGTTGADKTKTAYTVGLSAEWVEDAGQLIEGLDLKLRGVYFKVSNQ